VIFLLAGAIGRGIALDRRGAAKLISGLLTSRVDHLGPIAIGSVLYPITTYMTEDMSNYASAVLLTPIGHQPIP